MTRLGLGATVGIVGGGQLARMMAMEARRMGCRTVVLDPDPACCAGQVADDQIRASLTDAAGIARLARHADVVTVDTEHVSVEALREIERACVVRPSAHALRVVQDRRAQRMFLSSCGCPQPAVAFVNDPDDLAPAADIVGLPAIIKTRRSGYDGRGQVRVRRVEDLSEAWDELGRVPAVLESVVHFEREISVLLARTAGGELRCFPVAENVHREGVLHTTRVPARITESLATEARRVACHIAAELSYVGVLAVELFVGPGERVLVNEIALRPHNSGHFTLGACATSQFEQHVRAICDLPLGATDLLCPAAMLNLLGDLWHGVEPPELGDLLAMHRARLHLYGKAPRPRRKMGHVLFMDQDPDEVSRAADTAFAALSESRSREGARRDVAATVGS